MKSLRGFLAILTLFAAAIAAAVPSVLIVHLKPSGQTVGVEAAIADYVANELQTDGRVQPIVWSMTDPVFREAVESGKIPSGIDTPTLAEVQRHAGKLRAEYVLAIDMVRGEGEILATAYLYKSGRVVWKDPDSNIGPILNQLSSRLKKKEITQEEYENGVLHAKMRAANILLGSQTAESDTARAMARSWAQMIATGPFKALPKKPEVNTPDPGAGLIPSNNGTTPPKVGDDSKWNTEYAAALKAGESSRAVAILRDAVDAAPLDVARRVALIKTLRKIGDAEMAAAEARRAAELLPENLEFRAMAARCWIQAGKSDEAQEDLNEAIARAPDSAETRMLLGEVSIAKGDYRAAIEHLDKAIAAKPTGDAYYLRSIAHAMAGNVDKAASDTQLATATGLSADPDDAESRYALVASLFDESLNALASDIRTLQQKALVQRTDKEVQSTYAALAKVVAGREKFISGLPAPAGHDNSHARRVLAYKLLSQCMTDFDLYLRKGSEDVLTESRINLGEALKQSAAARLKFKDEQQGSKSNARSG